MIIYFILLIISLLLILYRRYSLTKFSKGSIIFLLIILLFLICVFRSLSVGVDYGMYYHLFEYYTYDEMKAIYSIEPGYAYLTTFARSINFFLIIPIFVFIINLIAFYFMKKQFNIDTFTLSAFVILTGFYFYMFSALRQIIAVGIVLIGICFLFKFNKHLIFSVILFIICIFIAKLFHNTAVFALIFLILPNVRYKDKTVAVLGLTTILLWITGVGTSIANKLLLIIPYYNEKYQNAASGLLYNPNKSIFQIIPAIMQFIFLYIFISNNTDLISKTKKSRFILSGYLLYLCLFAAFGSDLARRLQFYTFIFPVLFSCMFLNRNYRITRFERIMFILFWVIFYIAKLLLDRSHLVPYSII